MLIQFGGERRWCCVSKFRVRSLPVVVFHPGGDLDPGIGKAHEQCLVEKFPFALKGGATINLFIRDMPRLSVDIDLTYLPIKDRAASLAAIDAAMLCIKDRIEKGMPGAKITTWQVEREVAYAIAQIDRHLERRETAPPRMLAALLAPPAAPLSIAPRRPRPARLCEPALRR